MPDPFTLELLAAVRDGAEANMLDVRAVQEAADDRDLHALVLVAQACIGDRRGGVDRWVTALKVMAERYPGG